MKLAINIAILVLCVVYVLLMLLKEEENYSMIARLSCAIVLVILTVIQVITHKPTGLSLVLSILMIVAWGTNVYLSFKALKRKNSN